MGSGPQRIGYAPARRSTTVPKPAQQEQEDEVWGAMKSTPSGRIIIFLVIAAALYFISKKI